jgi:hypothetical protein
MFTYRYGAFIDPMPEEDSIARFAVWVPPQSRLGNKFIFPLQGSLEHGQTADVSGTAFNYYADIPMTMVNAEVDGFDWGMTARIPYSDMLRARNGVNQSGGGSAGSYFAPLDLKVKGLMRSSTLYRELWLCYGPGTGSTIASDIGQLATTGFLVSGGPNWNQTPVVKLKTASWIPGMWNLMKNAKLEVLNAAGTALVGSAGQFVQVNSIPTAGLTNVSFQATSTITAAVAAQQRLLPFGWYQKCCIGLEGILNNTGTLFNIDASLYTFWRAVTRDNGAAKLSRSIILGLCAQMFPNGLDQGATMFVSSAQFADLAEETQVVTNGSGATANTATVQVFNGNGDQTTKRIGTNKIVYVSPVGEITIQLYKYMKQGEAFLFGNGLVKRGGASDITFKGDGNQYFLNEIQGAAGYEIRCISNQSVFIETPYQCALIYNIASTFDIGQGVL